MSINVFLPFPNIATQLDPQFPDAMLAADNPIRFGIIGCARIARSLTRAVFVAPNAEVSAVGSRSLAKSIQFIADNGLSPDKVKAYGSYEEVLTDDDVDAVYVPLPTSLHVKWATLAAQCRKHVLLEKPTALCLADLDSILSACEDAGVQFMDATWFMHHPRTHAIRDIIADPVRFGDLTSVHSSFTFTVDDNFFENNIRVKPDLDALGALGDAGWYCVRAILWAADYALPAKATALDAVRNEEGVLLSCSASLLFNSGKVATFHASFLSHMSMDLNIMGTRGTIHVTDFVIPYEAKSAEFKLASNAFFNRTHDGWHPLPTTTAVACPGGMTQEARMVEEFSRLARGIQDGIAPADPFWPTITRKTQAVVDAVKASLDRGFVAVDVVF